MKEYGKLSCWLLFLTVSNSIITALGKTTEENGSVLSCPNENKPKVCKWNMSQEFLG